MIISPDHGHAATHGDGVAEVRVIRLIGGLEDLLLRPGRAVVSVHVSLAALSSAGGMPISPDHGHVATHGDGDAEVRVIRLIGGLKELLLPPDRAVVPIHVSLAAPCSPGRMKSSSDHGHVATHGNGSAEFGVIR